MSIRGKQRKINAKEAYIIKQIREKKRKKYKRTMPDGYVLNEEEKWGSKANELKALVQYVSMPHSVLSMVIDRNFFSSTEARVFQWIWKETFGKATYYIQYNFNLNMIVDSTGIKSKKDIRKCLNSLHQRNIIRLSYHTRRVQGAIQRYIPNGGMKLELIFDKITFNDKNGNQKWVIDISMWKDKEGVEIGVPQEEEGDNTILTDELMNELSDL